jgi:hypothetical protein
VLTPVQLDPRPDTPRPPLRPGDLLRSPVWLRPYGEEQVLAATVAGLPDPPWSDPVLDRTAVLGFLADRVMLHGGTLRGLLDAVHAAMQPQGPTVVLGVVDPADADRWVAAVGHLMSPGTSRRLYFSTAERVGGLGAARSAGLHLIVVPAAELRTVEPDDTVVLISDEDLPDGHPAVEFVDYDADLDTEQVHTTFYGSRIPATPWSMIATAILRDPALTAELLHRQDAIAATVGDRMLACGWPLALAVVERGLGHPGAGAADVLDETLPAARMIVREASPDLAGTALQSIVQRLQEEALGRTAADAWAALERGLPRGMNPRFARVVYLRRALQDRQWLLRDGGVPLPDMLGAVSQLGDTVVAEAHAALDKLAAEQVRADGSCNPDSAATALRLLDLVARAGLATHLDAARITDVLDRVVGSVLQHALTGPELIERIGPLAEVTQAKLVRPWLDRLLPQLPGRPGCRLTPLVLRWLFPKPPPPPSAVSFTPATVAESAAQATLVLGDPSAFRPVALTADLDAPTSWLTTRAALGPGLPVGAVLMLLERVEPRRVVDVLGPALLAAPSGPDLDTLLRRLGGTVGQPAWDTPAGRAVQQAVQLRTLEMSWQRAQEEDDRQPAFRRFVRLLRPLMQAGEPVAADLVASGSAADVIDRIHGFNEDAGPPLAQYGRSASTWVDAEAMIALARRVAHAVGAGITSDLRVVLAAQLGAQALDGALLGPASWRDLAELQWTSPKGREHHLLDHVVWLRLPELQRERPDGLDRLVAGARNWVERTTDELRRSGFDPHRALGDYDHVALRWWRRVDIPDDDALRVLRRRSWRSM